MEFMKLNKLNQKLIAAARLNAPDDRVPYAFEKRIMAQLAARPAPDGLALWAQALWRAAVPCLAIVLLVGVCSFFLPQTGNTVTAANTELSQDFENTLLAAVDQPASASEELQ